MKKVDSTVRRETLYIAAVTVVLAALMNLVFLVLGKWDMTVLFGSILGSFVAVMNFFLMGITVQGSIGKDEKTVKRRVWISLLLRMIMMFGFAAAAYFLPGAFNIIPLVICYVFPRIAILIRPAFKFSDGEQAEESDDGTNK